MPRLPKLHQCDTGHRLGHRIDLRDRIAAHRAPRVAVGHARRCRNRPRARPARSAPSVPAARPSAIIASSAASIARLVDLQRLGGRQFALCGRRRLGDHARLPIIIGQCQSIAAVRMFLSPVPALRRRFEGISSESGRGGSTAEWVCNRSVRFRRACSRFGCRQAAVLDQPLRISGLHRTR